MKRLVSLFTVLLLSVVFSASAFADTATTNAYVNFRTAASTSSKIIKALKPNTSMTVLSTTKYWAKVQVGTTVGYISMNYIDIVKTPVSETPPVVIPDPTPPVVTPAPWEVKADDIIEYAKTFIGVKYVWGGDYDKDGTYGFDCSGFVSYVYKKYGVTITRQSQASAQKDGYVVNKDDIRKGDIVYSDTNRDGKTNHMSIYIGNNQLLHTYGSGGVKITEWEGTHWYKTFTVAKRVL